MKIVKRIVTPVAALIAVLFGTALASRLHRAAAAEPFAHKSLRDLGTDERYRGEPGGLYASGKRPPRAHAELAMRAGRVVLPLSPRGFASSKGKIVVLCIGSANASQAFRTFRGRARQDIEVSPKLLLLDGSHPPADASEWARTANVKATGSESTPWSLLTDRLGEFRVSRAQVQVLWIQLESHPRNRKAPFPEHARRLQKNLATIVRAAQRKFPNLRLTYLSSSIYAGYANKIPRSEPYAFETGFAVRGLVTQQIQGEKSLNANRERGPVQAPVLLWGPYLWADGPRGNEAEELVWKRTDFGPDGLRLSPAGRAKAASQLLKFFKEHPTSRQWFAR